MAIQCSMHVIVLRRGTARNEHARRVLQADFGASADCYIHVSQAYSQEEKFAHRNCIPSPFPYVTKNIRPCKSVCFV